MRVLSLAGAVVAALAAMPAQAKEGDTLRPFVSYARYYDGNLFRLDKDGERLVLENGSPVLVTRETASDQYGVLSAGLNVDWQPGRQRVTASATKSQVRFSRYASLDYDGSDYQLNWNWRLGNHWSGQVVARENVTQSSFADWYSQEVVNNTVTRKNLSANAEWQFHPRWSAGAGVAAIGATNDTCPQKLSDYETDMVFATLGYATPKGSKLRGEVRWIDGDYLNRRAVNECNIPNTRFDRFYSQTEYNLSGDWSLTGKLVMRGRLGYVLRENDTRSERDFSGLAGRLSADYYPTGKALVNVAVYREIANADSIYSTYQLNTGASVGAAWLATPRITVRANASLENRSYEGDTGVSGIQREEETLSGSLTLSYSPVRLATIDVGLQAGRRDSNIPVSDYTFRSAFLSVRADF